MIYTSTIPDEDWWQEHCMQLQLPGCDGIYFGFLLGTIDGRKSGSPLVKLIVSNGKPRIVMYGVWVVKYNQNQNHYGFECRSENLFMVRDSWSFRSSAPNISYTWVKAEDDETLVDLMEGFQATKMDNQDLRKEITILREMLDRPEGLGSKFGYEEAKRALGGDGL